MTTTITVVSVGITTTQHHIATAEIAREAEAWEQRFSRFRPESMLSSVNATASTWATVDEIFTDLMETARRAVFATHGRFNPAILAAIEAQGYDRTIDEVRKANRPVNVLADSAIPLDAWAHVGIDRAGMRVRLPAGLRIDLGGIAKGALADRLADRFHGWPGGAISIGGDIRLWGTPPDGHTWRVGIEHPLEPNNDITAVELPGTSSVAIATSARTKRTWRTEHGIAHHLIDPATGMPTRSPLLAVSVCASTATMAEIVTKNVMVASAHEPITEELLLDAGWALLVSDMLTLSRITKEAA